MKKLKKIFLVIVFGSLILPVLNSCHKYSEDPFISFKKPGKRLNGTWKFVGYRINGTDHNHDFDGFLNPFTLTDCKMEFDVQTDHWSSGKYHLFGGDSKELPNTPSIQCCGYDFNLSPETIHISADSSFSGHLWKGKPTQGVSSALMFADWQIRELYKNNLHFRNGNTDIYFKKQ